MITVNAAWDPDAGVWYIASSSLAGLHLEARTVDALLAQVSEAIQDLLEGKGEQEVKLKFVTEGNVRVAA
jgi:predicted RNase H-like HicB family nuclease